MKKHGLKRKMVFGIALAGVLTMAAAVPAMAYFTTYVTAKGGYPVTLGDETEIHEDFENWKKHITLENTGKTEIYVRMQAFSGSQFTLDYTYDESLWSLGDDGYWYYSEILEPGESTEELVIAITLPSDYTESFDVVIVQECTMALYDEAGNPYADWNIIADSSSDVKTVEGGTQE